MNIGMSKSVVVVAWGLVSLAACGVSQETCKVVDLADHACTLFSYRDDNGQVSLVDAQQIAAWRKASLHRPCASASSAASETSLPKRVP